MPPSLTLPAPSVAAVPGASRARAWARLSALWHAPRSPQAIVCVLAVWLLATANWALWGRLAQADGHTGSALLLGLRFAALVLPGTVLLLGLTAWPRWMKPVWALLLVVAACAQHFMLGYGVVIDPVMVRNVLQTDAREGADLWHPALLGHLALVAGVPLLWLWRLPVRSSGPVRNVVRTTVLVLAAAATLVLAVLGMYREVAPVVRNNMAVRFAFNPVSPVLSAADVVLKPLLRRPKPFLSIAAGAQLGATYASAQRPPLLVLVVGETARADHFALNGYPRDTTPELAQRGVLSWRNVHACGTSTLQSVPCMFSHLGRDAYLRRVADYDNLLDVLQQAGLAVLWLDNQAGCKGVCARVPHASTEDALATPAARRLCDGGECLDDLMLEGLDARIAALPAERRQRGVVLVMHQMGSHGPAYFKRSPADAKPFQPECRTNALADCPHDALVNVYDNSIHQTDRFLARTLDWVRSQQMRYDAGFLYLSDHGETHGEMGLYLHGMPYAVAPEAQKHVPMVAWPGALATRTGVDTACLGRTLDAPLTHDNLYHTVLGLMDVRSSTYQHTHDAFAPCRTQSG